MNVLEKELGRQRRIKLFFFIATLLMLFMVVLLNRNLFLSFIFASVTYYLLAPIVDWLERKGLSRSLATAVPFVGLAIFVVVGLQLIIPMMADQAQSLKHSFPQYATSVSTFSHKLEIQVSAWLARVYPMDIRETVTPQIAAMTENFLKALPDLLSQSLTVFLLTPFLAYFMLQDGRDFSRMLFSLVPNNLFELSLHLHYQISNQVGGFIRARSIETILVGLVIWIGLSIIQFPYALLLAIFGGLLNVVPYLGPLIGAAPAFMIAFVQMSPAAGGPQAPWLALVIIYALSQILDMVLIVPFVVAKVVNLHPVTVVLAIILGAQFMGVIGMMISIPFVSIMKVSLSAVYDHATGNS